MLTTQPQKSPCIFRVPCGHHKKNTSISLTSPPVWNGVCPDGLTWEVSVYPPAEPCAVSLKIITGRVLCQAIRNRPFSKAPAVHCPHTVGSGGWAGTACSRGCRLSANIWQNTTGYKILFLEGKDGHQTPRREGWAGMVLNSPETSVFLCFIWWAHIISNKLFI